MQPFAQPPEQPPVRSVPRDHPLPGRVRVDPRPGRPDDVPAVEALVHAAYGHYVARTGTPPLPMLDDYAARVAAGQLWVLDGADAGGPLGVLVVEERPDHLYVDNVAVRPDAQGRGLGPALLAFAEERARAAGLPELRLVTNERMTENRALYARLGWTLTGTVVVEGRRAVRFARPVGPADGADPAAAADPADGVSGPV